MSKPRTTLLVDVSIPQSLCL